MNARSTVCGIIGAEVGFVTTVVLLQYVVLSSVEQILTLVCLTFLGYAIPRRLAS